ncbi:MAG: hypothetical protein ACE14W_01170 [Candidatus Velamenicoccus archaeovorus]
MAILGIALGVGAIVYALSLRSADETLALRPPLDDGDADPVPVPAPPAVRRRRRPRAVGFGPEAAEQTEPGGSVYVPLATDETPWQRRVAGLVGLVVLVAVAAAVLAGAIYQVGHLINQTIERFLQ